MSIPDWWEAVLLGAAAWRVFQLLSADDILDRPRRYVTRLGKKWEKEGDPVPKEYRIGLANWISCPYCLGFFVALGWWSAWEVWPHGSLVAASLLLLSSLVVAGDKFLSSSERV
jgi:hypothetical protein